MKSQFLCEFEMAAGNSPLLGRTSAGARGRTTAMAGLTLAGALACLALVAVVGMQMGAVEQLQLLAMGDAFDERPQSPNRIEYIGEIPVDDVIDHGLMDRPVHSPPSRLCRGVLLPLPVSAADFVLALTQHQAVAVDHALCNKDTDPDCETSISPFVDKSATGVQMLQQQRFARLQKARTQSLIMPWYEVASTGDGLGPETVTYWKLPPKAQMIQAQQADAEKAQDQALATKGKTDITVTHKIHRLGGAPPNTYQDPTVWNGDHVLNGGNKEWAEEDAALHAYNMQRWRNKIIGEQIDRQRSQWDLMNEADWCDCNCGARGKDGWDFKGARGTCGHHHSGGCGCSGQPGCGCSSTTTNNNNWNGGHSPGNSANSHSTASQSTDYGYHSSNSESGRGVHVSVTGTGHHVTVNGHASSDFGGGNLNKDGGDVFEHGHGYQW